MIMTKFFKLLTVLILLSCSLSIQAQKAKRHNKKQTKVAVISTKRQHYKTLPKWGVKVTHKPSNASLIKYRGVTYHLKMEFTIRIWLENTICRKLQWG